MAFQYKGFISSNIEEKEGIYSGTVTNSADYLNFEGTDLENCEDNFKDTVNKYLKKCEDIGKDPFFVIP